IDVSDLEHFPSALVAAFDFLGFKYMMQNADDLWRLVAQAKIVLDLIRATGVEETAFTFEGERSTSVPFVMNVSDTIIFVGPSSRSRPATVPACRSVSSSWETSYAPDGARRRRGTGAALCYPDSQQRVAISVRAVVPRARLEAWIGESAASSLVTTRPVTPGR